MTIVIQQRLWAFLELPVDVDEIEDLDRWRVIPGDPVALLEEALPFIGWGSCPDGLKERIRELVELVAADRSGSPTEEEEPA